MNEILELQNSIMNELVEGHGFRGVAKLLSASLGKSVIITNPSSRVLGVAKELPIAEGYHLVYSNDNPENSHYKVRIEEEVFDAIYEKITGKNNKYLGNIFVLTEPEDALSLNIIQRIIPICALEFAKNYYILQAQREYKDAFIYDLLYSNIASVHDVIQRGEIWGWNLNRPHVVLVFELQDYFNSTEDKNLVDDIFGIINTLLHYELENPILLAKRAQIILILPAEFHYESQKGILSIVNRILECAQERSKERKIAVGIGHTYDSPKEIFKSFQEAKVALELGKLVEEPSSLFFEDLGFIRLLYNHDRQELKEFYKETLGPLEHFDEEQGNDLMSTLETYLKNQCDLKVTAQELFLHPNTLRYRSKKIEDILTIQLDDFETRLNLTTAFKIRYILRRRGD